jgi:hypothetical protein
VCQEETVKCPANSARGTEGAGYKTNISAIEDWMDVLEQFVVSLYDRTSSHESVNQVRKQLFTQKARAIDGLPPT